MKKVIITGPTGAIGVSLINDLISHNIEVTAVCRPNSKRLDSIPKHNLVSIVECNIDNLKELQNTLTDDYDAFYHFAWEGTYGGDRQNLYLQSNNIKYTLDAVELAHKLGCKVFIGAGSQSEFGHVSGVLHSDTPCNPDNGYGIAKLSSYMMSKVRCQQLNIKHIWCRILSVFGPFDGPHTMVMSGINKMLDGERPQYTKGEQIWDYLYNKDAARAFRLIAEKGQDNSIYCLGSGRTRMLKDYIYAIRDAIDPSIDIGVGELDYYPNQVMHLEADISNLTKDTGFTPQYSFEEGIRETIAWVKEQRNR